MATPPTPIQTVTIPFARQANVQTRTSAAFDVLAGDLIVVRAMTEDSTNAVPAVSNNGVALTWTPAVANAAASNVAIYIWTAVVPAGGRTGLTVTLTTTGTSTGPSFGGRIKTWRNHGGVGVANVAADGTAPTVTLTGVGPNSAIDAECGDWNAGTATATWGGTVAPTSEYAQTEFGAAGFYMGVVADAGAAGSKVISMASVPVGAVTKIAAVEIKAATAGQGGPSASTVRFGTTAAGTKSAAAPAAATVKLQPTVTGAKSAQAPAAPANVHLVPAVAGRKTASAPAAATIKLAAQAAGAKTALAPAAATIKLPTTVTGAKTALAPAAATVHLVPAVAGRKQTSAPSAATVRFTTTATGTQAGTHQGPSSATVRFATTAAGTKTASAASSAAVHLQAAAAGAKGGRGASSATLRLIATALGGQPHQGPSTATVRFATTAAGTKTALVPIVATVRLQASATGRKAAAGPGAIAVRLIATVAGLKQVGGASGALVRLLDGVLSPAATPTIPVHMELIVFAPLKLTPLDTAAGVFDVGDEVWVEIRLSSVDTGAPINPNTMTAIATAPSGVNRALPITQQAVGIFRTHVSMDANGTWRLVVSSGLPGPATEPLLLYARR